MSALFQIGKASLPSLVRVIETKEENSLESQNALETIWRILITFPESEIFLQGKVGESKDSIEKHRLYTAIDKTTDIAPE